MSIVETEEDEDELLNLLKRRIQRDILKSTDDAVAWIDNLISGMNVSDPEFLLYMRLSARDRRFLASRLFSHSRSFAARVRVARLSKRRERDLARRLREPPPDTAEEIIRLKDKRAGLYINVRKARDPRSGGMTWLYDQYFIVRIINDDVCIVRDQYDQYLVVRGIGMILTHQPREPVAAAEWMERYNTEFAEYHRYIFPNPPRIE